MDKIRATEIGEFIRFKSCERRFKLEFDKRKEARKLLFADRLFNTLDPVLQEIGEERELQWKKSLDENGYTQVFSGENLITEEEREAGFNSFFKYLETAEKNKLIYGREIPLFGKIGNFKVEGRSDFLLVYWKDKVPFLKIVECKSSRKDKTYHKIQISIYKLILEEKLSKDGILISGENITSDQIECVVARVNEDTNDPQPILSLSPLNLSMETSDLIRLTDNDGYLKYILSKNLDELSYQIESKCDSCVFNVHCLSESGRKRSNHLLGLEPAIIRILANNSINSIDQLADLDSSSETFNNLLSNPEFNVHLENLIIKAKSRRSTLPGNKVEGEFPVIGLKNTSAGQLPKYDQAEDQLIRIYLNIDYDYVENRIGAISAHVTNSKNRLKTPFEDHGPSPTIKEGPLVGTKVDDSKLTDPVGINISEYITSPWTGVYNTDTGTEKYMIQKFFNDLLDAIAALSASESAKIHFYVWSKSEMSHLVEACSRAGSDLLGRLKELLGCREPTEQLIYSSLQEEVISKYALGWTGKGLSVITSLPWFGDFFHWTRTVNGQAVKLDHVFTQDIFDFKTNLELDDENNWVKKDQGTKHLFEIRTRFFDSLSAPYWRAMWRSLKLNDKMDHKLRSSIERYNQSSQAGYLKSYLQARCHALRWIEEKMFKNADIQKPALVIEKIRQFRISVESSIEAGIDFLQLNHHINMSDWLVMQLTPPKYRVLNGKTLPVKNIRPIDKSGNVVADINLENFDISIESLKLNCELTEGFSRMTICDSDPSRGQTINQLFRFGSTCIIKNVDWDNLTVSLRILPLINADRYRLMSLRAESFSGKFATIDESPSDYVAGDVESQLSANKESPIKRWFHPQNPIIPETEIVSEKKRIIYRELLENFKQPNGHTLGADQVTAILEGLSTTIQLLQGPPGTGKTTTTATAVLLRILDSVEGGGTILISSLTHTAIDNLLGKISEVLPLFQKEIKKYNLEMPNIIIGKADSNFEGTEQIIQISEKNPTAIITKAIKNSTCTIVGGTTSKLIKLIRALNSRTTFQKLNNSENFATPLLVIDEASMVVFPYFLALTSFLKENGKVMLAGDHRQLSPIVSNEWDSEDRPPTILYKPFVSSYIGVESLKNLHSITDMSLKKTYLDFSFRLPPSVRELISKIYIKDNIQLKGYQATLPLLRHGNLDSFQKVWASETGLYLIVHNENKSRRSNLVEAKIIREIIKNVEISPSSTAVITPHRAQRTLLKRELKDFTTPIDVIDTVERMQGGERPNIFVSGTVSDPTTISNRAEFILNLNRANVAFSRTQKRLFVICSQSLLDHIPPDSENYESALLWKSVREVCNIPLFEGSIENTEYKVFTFNQDLIKREL